MSNQPLGSKQLELLQKAINQCYVTINPDNTLDHGAGWLHLHRKVDQQRASRLECLGLILLSAPSYANPYARYAIQITTEGLAVMGTSWKQLAIDQYTEQLNNETYMSTRWGDAFTRPNFESIRRSDNVEFLTELYDRPIDIYEAWCIQGERVFNNSLNYETTMQGIEHKIARIELI